MPLIEPVGIQNGLQYNTFKFLNLNSPLSGIRPQSAPNVMGGALVGNLAAGELQLAASGSIEGSAAFPYFDLESVYYGCYVYEGPQTVAVLASACLLSITGFDHQDKAVSATGAAFSPPGPIGTRSSMNFETFDNFTKMKNVTIGVSSASPLTALGVLVLDDLKHCNYAA